MISAKMLVNLALLRRNFAANALNQINLISNVRHVKVDIIFQIQLVMLV